MNKFKNIDKKSLVLVVIIILTSTASFGLGRLSIIEQVRAKDGVEIIIPKLGDLKVDESKFEYLASKSGTKYYPIGCKSANRIKPENRVYFNSVDEAEEEGLTLAAGC
jgi:hypothetical protein